MPARKKTPLQKPGPAAKKPAGLDFTTLVAGIRQVHEQSAAAVSRTVNTTLTLRNWVIGAYIHHYQLNGSDRAEYGEAVIDRLAEALERAGVNACDRIRLYLYRNFARTYPQIGGMVCGAGWSLLSIVPIVRSLTEQSETRADTPIFRSLAGKSQKDRIVRSVTAQSGAEAIGGAAELWLSEIRQTPSAKFATDGRLLIERLSFTHLEQLIALSDPLKRAFYEIECIRGNWSVRDLKRQIATLYFERSGLSKDKEKLAAMVQEGIESEEPKLAIRDPYIFEFLGLRAKDAVAETDLEAALVEHLREFLLELSHGFCLEAQQKSIVIGKTRGFVDLVFYHRILKCHVLVDLKVDEFRHEHIGQLNTYVTWYRKHIMAEGDNPPVGILLCTEKDHSLVEYATASMDNQLFVSKYAVELPTKAELVKFLETHRREITGATARRPRKK